MFAGGLFGDDPATSTSNSGGSGGWAEGVRGGVDENRAQDTGVTEAPVGGKKGGVAVERNISRAVEILRGVLARSSSNGSSNGNEQAEHLDVNQLPIYCLYVFCLGAIKLEELALYAAAKYPNVVGMDIARQIPDFAGKTAGWLSGAFSGIRDAELLPFASSAWPDGEKASESEAAAELGLEIVIAIAVCSAFVPAVLGFVWRLLFGTPAQEREQLRLQLHRQVLYFGRFCVVLFC